MRTRNFISVAIIATLAFTAACAPAISVGVNAAGDIPIAAYRTYSWVLPDQFPVGDPRLDNNPFFVRQLQNAVSSQLNGIGLREASGATDLAVHFHATVRDRVDYYDVDRKAGYDQTGYSGSVAAYQFEEGTVMIDIAERSSKKVIWRGWMQTDISGVIGNDTKLGERIQRGMKKLFEKFPATCVAGGGN